VGLNQLTVTVMKKIKVEMEEKVKKILARIKNHSDKENGERKKRWEKVFSSFYDQENWDKLLASSNACIDLFPEWDICYIYRGIAKIELGDYEGAIEDYDKAIELNGEMKTSYFNRGIVKGKLGDYEGEIEDYNKAIELDGEDADAYYNRGIAKKNLKDYEGAIEDYDKAIELNDEFTKAYLNRGNAKYDLGDSQGAIDDYNKAIELDSEDAKAYYNRGIAKGELGDEQGALEDKLKAEELESSKLKILLIDDDENICKILKEELEEENYTINYSLRGEEGLQQLKLKKYNLVILNYMMPGMKGDEVLEQIKRIYPSMPVIILTAYSDVDTARKFGRMGASDFVSKPYDFDDLLERVQKFILKT